MRTTTSIYNIHTTLPGMMPIVSNGSAFDSSSTRSKNLDKAICVDWASAWDKSLVMDAALMHTITQSKAQ